MKNGNINCLFIFSNKENENSLFNILDKVSDLLNMNFNKTSTYIFNDKISFDYNINSIIELMLYSNVVYNYVFIDPSFIDSENYKMNYDSKFKELYLKDVFGAYKIFFERVFFNKYAISELKNKINNNTKFCFYSDDTDSKVKSERCIKEKFSSNHETFILDSNIIDDKFLKTVIYSKMFRVLDIDGVLIDLKEKIEIEVAVWFITAIFLYLKVNYVNIK